MKKRKTTLEKKAVVHNYMDTQRTAETYRFCLAADEYVPLPVNEGNTIIITANIDAFCDGRGWSCDNWSTSCGPEGMAGFYDGTSYGDPHAPIGMLIGAITPYDSGLNPIGIVEIPRIFGSNTLLVGPHYQIDSPLDGFLYLIMNDNYTPGDNKGSVLVNVTVLL